MAETLSRVDVLKRVQEIVAGVVGNPVIDLQEATTADQVPGWDSLTHIQIIIAVEKTFQIRLKASEVAQLNNVGSLIDIVLARRTA